MRRCMFSALVAVAAASAADAAYVIDIGAHNLQPNTAGQTISIYVSRTGSEMISAMDLFAQVGDGGVDNGGVDNGPWITDIDLLTNTVLAAGNQSEVVPGVHVASSGMIYARSADVAASVPAEGKIATITISTVGISSGNYTLSLDNVMGEFDTSFSYLGVSTVAQVIPGVIAVPEPMVAGLFASTAVSALAVRPRRRAQNS